MLFFENNNKKIKYDGNIKYKSKVKKFIYLRNLALHKWVRVSGHRQNPKPRLIIRFRDYKYNKNIQALDKNWHIFSNSLRQKSYFV